MKDPYRVYCTQKMNARRRRISWNLSYEQWWDIWTASGQYDQRGRSPDGAVMARIDPREGYSRDNVQICTGSQAAQNYWQSACRPQALIHNRTIAQMHCKAVHTPMGDYPSAVQAAQAMNISKSALNYRLRNWPAEYYTI